MTINVYPNYKYSEIEWIGKIPIDWEIKKLKYLGEVITGLTYSPEDVVDESEGCLVLRSSNIKDGVITYTDNVYVDMDIPEKLLTRKKDILICSRNGSRKLIGKSALIDPKSAGLTFGAFTTVFRSSHSEFLAYVFQSPLFKFQIGSCLTSTINQLTVGNLNSLQIPFPPHDVQKSIVDFLKEKTDKIDRLLMYKEKLIKLLEEKRRVMITEAVTKGLQPNVKMKDSNVEWVGKIPEHWEIKKIKYILQSTKGSIKTGPFGSELTNRDMEASDVKVYNQRTVLDQNFEKGEYYISNEKFNELKAFEVKPLDLLITTRGTIGKVAIVPKDVEKGILHPCLIRMQVNQSMVNLSYLEYIFNDTDLIKEQIYLLSNATTIEVIYSETLKNISIAIPNTIQEQNQIVEYLNRETFKIDQIINQVKLQVPKLKEYRQSLIYEAVTGKIDVQNIEIEA